MKKRHMMMKKQLLGAGGHEGLMDRQDTVGGGQRKAGGGLIRLGEGRDACTFGLSFSCYKCYYRLLNAGRNSTNH